MQKFSLTADPCDYRLIWLNNWLYCLACICDIAAIINDKFRQLSNILHLISDVFYHTISGCMTAQVAHELNHQYGTGSPKAANYAATPVAQAELFIESSHYGETRAV
jgi:hypothetical protein